MLTYKLIFFIFFKEKNVLATKITLNIALLRVKIALTLQKLLKKFEAF